MRNERFEWDDHKAARNYAKHKVTFEEATHAFDDPGFLEKPEDWDLYGEDRFTLIGKAGNKLLVVIYTERGNRIRIISARKATQHEWEDYLRHKAP